MKIPDAVAQMLATIEQEARLTAAQTGCQAISSAVLQAMAKVPRHCFVPEDEQTLAYYDGPLGIGHGQTISQPFIVALMTELLGIGAHSRVLEVGTGSGYQAAVLAQLAEQVYSVEIIEALARTARERLQELGYRNIRTRHGDGYLGWPEHAPYDGIIVTAAAPQVPEPLIEQLVPTGRLVIPVGSPWGVQQLTLLEKDREGGVHRHNLLPVAFVPLTRPDKA